MPEGKRSGSPTRRPVAGSRGGTLRSQQSCGRAAGLSTGVRRGTGRAGLAGRSRPHVHVDRVVAGAKEALRDHGVRLALRRSAVPRGARLRFTSERASEERKMEIYGGKAARISDFLDKFPPASVEGGQGQTRRVQSSRVTHAIQLAGMTGSMHAVRRLVQVEVAVAGVRACSHATARQLVSQNI